jgi:putative endonuclease
LRYNINERGQEGEDRAAAMLEARGYRLLSRNFRSLSGEIDIVAIKDDTVVFVEVKSWDTFPKEDLERSLGKKKRARIEKTALFFLHKHREFTDYHIRYDLVFLSRMTGEADHITDIFN